MRLIKVISTVVLFFLSINVAQAAYSWGASNIVERYFPVNDQIVYIRLAAAAPNPAGCSSDYYYAISSDNPNFEEYQKMALTAIAAGLKLRVAVENGAGDCHNGHPKVNRMYIHK